MAQEGRGPLRTLRLPHWGPKVPGQVRALGFSHLQLPAGELNGEALAAAAAACHAANLSLVIECAAGSPHEAFFRASPLDGLWVRAPEGAARLMLAQEEHLFSPEEDRRWANNLEAYGQLAPENRKFEHYRVLYSLLEGASGRILPLDLGGLLRAPNYPEGRPRLDNARALLGYQYAHPGDKLVALESLAGLPEGLTLYLLALNQWAERFQRAPGLEGFHPRDVLNSVVSLVVSDGAQRMLALINFTPTCHPRYRVGLKALNAPPGVLREVLSSDARPYGGMGTCNLYPIPVQRLPYDGYPCSAEVVLPPLGAVFFSWEQ